MTRSRVMSLSALVKTLRFLVLAYLILFRTLRSGRFLQDSLDAIDRESIRENAIVGASLNNVDSEVVWFGIPLPTGVFDLGPIYDVLPPTQAAVQLDSILFTIDTSDPEIFFAELGQRSVEDQIEIERALQGLYGSQPTGFSFVVGALGVEAQVEPIRFLRSELGIAIPEPCSAILIPLAGAGLFLRRRRA